MADKERFGKLPDQNNTLTHRERCENCRFYGLAIPGKMPNTCRFNTPTMIHMGNGQVAGMWSPVEPGYWCGQWKEQASDAYELPGGSN